MVAFWIDRSVDLYANDEGDDCFSLETMVLDQSAVDDAQQAINQKTM